MTALIALTHCQTLRARLRRLPAEVTGKFAFQATTKAKRARLPQTAEAALSVALKASRSRTCTAGISLRSQLFPEEDVLTEWCRFFVFFKSVCVSPLASSHSARMSNICFFASAKGHQSYV